MRRDRWFLIASMLLVSVFVLFNFFSSLGVRGFILRRQNENKISDREKLTMENEQLKARIANLEQIHFVPAESYEIIPAFVYSRYPFNLKSEILVSAGKNQGVNVGQSVFYNGLFLGKVKESFKNSASVQTIFDSHFEFAVRLGDTGTDALLKGGDEPKLTLIPKGAEVSDGMSVYSSSVGVPYGAALGEIRDFRFREGAPFGEAMLKLSYRLSDIHVVEILKE